MQIQDGVCYMCPSFPGAALWSEDSDVPTLDTKTAAAGSVVAVSESRVSHRGRAFASGSKGRRWTRWRLSSGSQPTELMMLRALRICPAQQRLQGALFRECLEMQSSGAWDHADPRE